MWFWWEVQEPIARENLGAQTTSSNFPGVYTSSTNTPNFSHTFHTQTSSAHHVSFPWTQKVLVLSSLLLLVTHLTTSEINSSCTCCIESVIECSSTFSSLFVCLYPNIIGAHDFKFSKALQFCTIFLQISKTPFNLWTNEFDNMVFTVCPGWTSTCATSWG